MIDAPVSIDAHVVDAPVDGPGYTPSAALSHTLFLELEGVTVTVGAATDATTNTSTIPTATTTLAGWRVNDGSSRATELAALVTQLQTTLAPYHIDVVTTRPAAAPYMMIVVTDDPPTKAGLPTGVAAAAQAATSGCNMITNEVAFAFPSGNYSAGMLNMVAANSIAMFGFEYGVPQSMKADDCMCFEAASSCGTYQTACTIGGAGTAVYANGSCGDSAATMNEGAMFLAAFGPH